MGKLSQQIYDVKSTCNDIVSREVASIVLKFGYFKDHVVFLVVEVIASKA